MLAFLFQPGKGLGTYLNFFSFTQRVIQKIIPSYWLREKACSTNFECIYILIIYFCIMASLRHQNDPSFDEDDLDLSDSDVESIPGRKATKGPGRPGRPRGKGRPKRSSKLAAKKDSQDEQEWEEKVFVRERVAPAKQQSSTEGYIKIIDYLKKIDCDQSSLQNKMNPYNALTATCFWYAVSAEYFSFDFNSKKNSHDVALEILEKIQKLPLVLANRTLKNTYCPSLSEPQSDELQMLAIEMSEKMSNLTPAPLAYRSQLIERKIPLSTVAEDDEFVSSTRSIIYNYIAKKVKGSDKWSGLVSSFSRDLQNLPAKQFDRPAAIELPKDEQPCPEVNLFELLRQQAKKKVQKKEKAKQSKKSKEGDIFHEEQIKEEQLMKQQEQIEAAKQLKNSQENIKIPTASPLVPEYISNQASPEKMEVEEQQNPQKNQGQAQKIIEQQINLKQEDPIQEKRALEQEPVARHMVEEVNQKNNSAFQGEQQGDFTYKKKLTKQDLILESIKHMPLDKVISIMQSNLPTIQLPGITDPFMSIPTKDPLQFVYQLHPDEEKYLDYMKQQRKKKYREKLNNNETNTEDEEKEGQYQDAKCQICTDGDYTDDNLIVFCSMCNISLHQRCVGLAKVPAESWICEVCLAFGPAGINLPCPLCNVKGGAMKRTSIHIDSNLFKQTNPSYYEYSKKCPYCKQKEEYLPKQKVQGQEEQPAGEPLVKVVRERGQKQQECYYDYFVKSTYPLDIPVCHYVWVHYVCAIWVPECYFEQKNGMISVKGIENIDHRRFRSECFACKKNKCGAAVKCQDPQCNKYYHPECARKKKVYMEQLNLQKLKYLIFCEEHEPLKLTRQIEYKKKKSRQQIIKFARMIEKYIQTYRIAQFPYKLMKSAVPHNFIDTSGKSERDQHKDRKASAAHSDEVFLKELIANLSKAKMMTVHLQKVDNGYKITNVQTPSKREIRKCLNRYDQFWNSIKNGDSIEDNFRRYERIMMENQKLREKLQLFLNGTLSIRSKPEEKKEKKTGKKRGRQANNVETLIEEEGGIFCVCKKPYEGETDMFECQVCGEWYHFKCIGFIGTEEDAQGMDFTCMKCMKFEDKEKKQQRLNKYASLFSADSILYRYRPPTPDLLSQEEVQQKNYQAIMQEYKQSMSPKKEKVTELEQKEKIIDQLPIRKSQIEASPVILNNQKNEKIKEELYRPFCQQQKVSVAQAIQPDLSAEDNPKEVNEYKQEIINYQRAGQVLAVALEGNNPSQIGQKRQKIQDMAIEEENHQEQNKENDDNSNL